jgi:general secretion pathway protein G
MLLRPLTRLEKVLYAVIVAILVATLAEKFLDHMELAERTAMEVTISNVNSAISMRLAHERLRDGARLPAWALGDPFELGRISPFELARMSPSNFLGERDSGRLASVERGSWIYDRARGELVYLPRLQRTLSTRDPDVALRFRLQSMNHGAHVMLVPTSKYHWQ